VVVEVVVVEVAGMGDGGGGERGRAVLQPVVFLLGGRFVAGSGWGKIKIKIKIANK